MCVYRYEDGADTKRSGAVEKLGGFGAIGIDIELQEEWLIGSSGGYNGGKRIRCVVRDLSYSASAQVCPLRALLSIAYALD